MWLIINFLLITGIIASNSQSTPEERNKFILYGQIATETFNLSEATKILRNNAFDNAKKTVLYIHGYNETQHSESVQTIVAAYRQRTDYNLITLDWRQDAAGNYLFDALPNVKIVGMIVAKVLLQMIDAGLSLQRLHLVGHSLGGQMVGRIGREIRNRSNNRVILKRVSALDPAFPGFYGPFLQHINQDDAELVDVIHTDAWQFGAPLMTGSVDFWPNRGISIQPGCPPREFSLKIELNENTLCSHWRSWRFWAESVKNENSKFYAVKASSWTNFQHGKTTQFNSTIIMGNDCPTGITGNYYLQTNSQSPFARGKEGIKYTRQ